MYTYNHNYIVINIYDYNHMQNILLFMNHEYE